MNDYGRDDPGDERLRAAFRHGGTVGSDPRRVDSDAFLARVRAGGRRRRARRAVGVTVVAAAAAAVVGTGLVTLTDEVDRPDAPVARGNTAPDGQPPEKPGGDSGVVSGERRLESSRRGPLAAYDVQVPDDDSVWALASRDCGRAQLCPVVARSDDDGASWQTTVPRAADGGEVLGDFRDLAVADNGSDVFAAGVGIATSHDRGSTWRPVDLAAGRTVRGVAAGADEVVVAFDDTGAGALATSPVGVDAWTAAVLPIAPSDRVRLPFAGGDVVGATVTVGAAAEVTTLVARGAGTGWTQLAAPCATSTPLVATDGATLWYLCYGSDGSTLATADVAAGLSRPTWTTTTLPAADNAGLGAWDDGTAVVSTDDRLFRVDARGETVELTGSSSGLDLGRDDYTFRATDTRWLATFRGRLLHTTDDGASWSPVRAP